MAPGEASPVPPHVRSPLTLRSGHLSLFAVAGRKPKCGWASVPVVASALSPALMDTVPGPLVSSSAFGMSICCVSKRKRTHRPSRAGRVPMCPGPGGRRSWLRAHVQPAALGASPAPCPSLCLSSQRQRPHKARLGGCRARLPSRPSSPAPTRVSNEAASLLVAAQHGGSGSPG